MKFSVITVCFNAAATIRDTLRSVAAQTHPLIEHIVIDGGSSDGTLDIIAEFPHVARIVSERDAGIYDAMNKGLRLATGDAIGFLNSDDFFSRADALALLSAGLMETGADAVAADVALVDPTRLDRVRRHYAVTGYRSWMLRFGHMPPHATLYVRREILEQIGEFDPSYRIAGDFELTVRLLLGARASLHLVPATLVGFREGGVSTRDVKAKFRMNAEILHALRRNGISAGLLQLYARYPFKALQYMTGASDYHVPEFLDRGSPVAPQRALPLA